MKNGKDKKDTNNGNAKNKWNLPHNRWHKRNKKLPDQLIESRSDSELNQIVKIPSASERNKNDKFLLDGNKMLWHLDRLESFKKGKRFAPVHIDQGLSKGCNIACHFCYGVTQGNFYKKGSERIFERNALLNNYIKSAGEVGVRSIALIGEAEPTLNPNVYDAIVVGKNSGISMSIATNGILWDTSSKGEAALENLEWMRFNISAASHKSYIKIHASKEFDTAIKKIKYCVKTKKKKNLDLTIGLQMVLTPKCIGEVVPLAKLSSQLGVDYLQIKHCSDTVKNDLGFFERLDEYHKFVPILKEAESYSNENLKVIVKWDKITNEGKREYNQCLGAPFLLYGEGTGLMYSCGMFFSGAKYEKDFLMGDLNKQTFKEIIESDRYWNVVDKVKNEIDVHKECYANCRTHSCNNFLWDVKDGPVDNSIRQKHGGSYVKSGTPPPHKNFI
jgi:MoaA/NifB/PqqE/SkfB family radical SAM enzyme